MRKIQIGVEVSDILDFEADVLALKYAQKFYGADAAVVGQLLGHSAQLSDITCKPDGFRLVRSGGAVNAEQVLFVGVKPLREFGYLEIRQFGRKVLEVLAGSAPDTRHVCLTLHGPGYGLDEAEAFQAQVAGLVDAITSNDIPRALERVTIVELNPGRAARLEASLPRLIPGGAVELNIKSYLHSLQDKAAEQFRSVGYASGSKPHIFVAMPFSDDMDDIYHYGIRNAVSECNLLCERADMSAFTGDILDWIKRRIDSSVMIIADLTDSNPNVYLEVGYAWGKGIPTVLLIQNADELRFDVQGQRCLVYTTIKDLEDRLRKELQGIVQ